MCYRSPLIRRHPRGLCARLSTTKAHSRRRRSFGASVPKATEIRPRPWPGTLKELLRRDEQVRQNLAALRTDKRPPCHWRGLIYRSHRAAAEGGIRAAIWIALAGMFLVYAGWPAASTSLAVIGAFVGLGAITPNSRATTVLAPGCGTHCRFSGWASRVRRP